MSRDTERRRPDRNRDAAESLSNANNTTTAGGSTFTWSECPDHPWYGVSVMETPAGALCVPPLDGVANHWVAR